jgi:hypothetical protein
MSPQHFVVSDRLSSLHIVAGEPFLAWKPPGTMTCTRLSI